MQYTYYIGAFLLSMLCGFIFIPLITRFCIARGLYDLPGIRKVHSRPVPRLGGITFMPSMLLASVIALFILNRQSAGGIRVSLSSLYFIICLFIVYSTGVVDDLTGLNAIAKLVAETAAALLLPFSGLYINNLYGLFGIGSLPFWAGAPLTVLVIVLCCNAINLIDGIDGLSACLSLTSLAGFFVCFYNEGVFLYCVMIASLGGILVSFLRYNIFGNEQKRQKIFMGDSGSLSLGFILGFLAVKYCIEVPTMSADQSHIVWAWTLLAVPCLDTVRVFFYRICHGLSPFHPDKRHIHHIVLACGLSQHQALLAIMALQLLMVAVGALLSDRVPALAILLIDIAMYSAFMVVARGLRVNVKERKPQML